MPVRALARQLGPQSVIDVDPLDRHAASVGRLDGLLTGPRGRPQAVALDYVRPADVFGLSAATWPPRARARLRRHRRHPPPVLGAARRRPAGVRQRPPGQRHQGRPARQRPRLAGARLRAPAPPARAQRRRGDTRRPSRRRRAARRRTGPRRHRASRAVPDAGGCGRLADRDHVRPTTDSSVVDAPTGRPVPRHAERGLGRRRPSGAGRPTCSSATRVQAAGGTRTARCADRPRLAADAARRSLFGNNVHTYADVNDDDVADAAEEIAAGRPDGLRVPVHAERRRRRALRRTRSCTWDPNVPFSWQDNRKRRTPRRSSTSSTSSTTTCRPRRSASPRRPATSRGQRDGRAGGDPVTTSRSTAPTPTTACPTATTSTTPTWPRRRTATRRPCRCTCSTARHDRRPGPVPADQRRRRGRRRVPRVHPRPVQPAGRRRRAATRRWTRPGRLDGRGLERLVRHGLPGQRRASHGHRRARRGPRVGDYVGRTART